MNADQLKMTITLENKDWDTIVRITDTVSADSFELAARGLLVMLTPRVIEAATYLRRDEDAFASVATNDIKQMEAF